MIPTISDKLLPNAVNEAPTTDDTPFAPAATTVNYQNMDRELLKVWQLVHDLSEQLAHNQKITASLQNQAQSLQVSLRDPKHTRSSHHHSLFSLRRTRLTGL